MTDFTQLAAQIATTRADLLAAERLEADRRSGLAALRPAIDQLEKDVRPILEQARDALAPSGVTLCVEDGWTGEERKAATLAITCGSDGRWPSRAGNPQGRRFIIEAAGGTLTVRSRPFHHHDDRDATPIDVEPGAEAEAIVHLAVESFLAVATAEPVMHGVELRGHR